MYSKERWTGCRPRLALAMLDSQHEQAYEFHVLRGHCPSFTVLQRTVTTNAADAANAANPTNAVNAGATPAVLAMPAQMEATASADSISHPPQATQIFRHASLLSQCLYPTHCFNVPAPTNCKHLASSQPTNSHITSRPSRLAKSPPPCPFTLQPSWP